MSEQYVLADQSVDSHFKYGIGALLSWNRRHYRTYENKSCRSSTMNVVKTWYTLKTYWRKQRKGTWLLFFAAFEQVQEIPKRCYNYFKPGGTYTKIIKTWMYGITHVPMHIYGHVHVCVLQMCVYMYLHMCTQMHIALISFSPLINSTWRY